MLSVQVQSSTAFAVASRYIDSYLNYTPSGSFRTNVTGTPIPPQTPFDLYQSSNGVQYGIAGNGCLTRIRYGLGQFSYLTNTSTNIPVGSTLAVNQAAVASESIYLQDSTNFPQKYDMYGYADYNSSQASYLYVITVPTGQSPNSLTTVKSVRISIDNLVSDTVAYLASANYPSELIAENVGGERWVVSVNSWLDDLSFGGVFAFDYLYAIFPPFAF